jgi:hypothetical protein
MMMYFTRSVVHFLSLTYANLVMSECYRDIDCKKITAERRDRYSGWIVALLLWKVRTTVASVVTRTTTRRLRLSTGCKCHYPDAQITVVELAYSILFFYQIYYGYPMDFRLVHTLLLYSWRTRDKAIRKICAEPRST